MVLLGPDIQGIGPLRQGMGRFGGAKVLPECFRGNGQGLLPGEQRKFAVSAEPVIPVHDLIDRFLASDILGGDDGQGQIFTWFYGAAGVMGGCGQGQAGVFYGQLVIVLLIDPGDCLGEHGIAKGVAHDLGGKNHVLGVQLHQGNRSDGGGGDACAPTVGIGMGVAVGYEPGAICTVGGVHHEVVDVFPALVVMAVPGAGGEPEVRPGGVAGALHFCVGISEGGPEHRVAPNAGKAGIFRSVDGVVMAL